MLLFQVWHSFEFWTYLWVYGYTVQLQDAWVKPFGIHKITLSNSRKYVIAKQWMIFCIFVLEFIVVSYD